MLLIRRRRISKLRRPRAGRKYTAERYDEVKRITRRILKYEREKEMQNRQCESVARTRVHIVLLFEVSFFILGAASASRHSKN